jgi:hypothetical protein
MWVLPCCEEHVVSVVRASKHRNLPILGDENRVFDSEAPHVHVRVLEQRPIQVPDESSHPPTTRDESSHPPTTHDEVAASDSAHAIRYHTT